MMEQNLSCSSGGRSGSESISALPRMAVSGVRSSWATSLTNADWRRSLSARSICWDFVFFTSESMVFDSSSASCRRPSGASDTSEPERTASVFFTSTFSGSARKWPMMRLSTNVASPVGTRSRNAFGGVPKAMKQVSTMMAPASSMSSVASNEKYVCSLFIV